MTKERLLKHDLNNGWVTLDRELVDGNIFLHFAVELNTNFPAEEMFEQLVLGMTDSQKSWFWPNKYESCPEPLEGSVKPGCSFRMTYRVPRFDKPEIPAVPVTYSYTLPQYRPEECLLEYRSIDHPLAGGATVKVTPLDENRSRMNWVGKYQQDPSQHIVVQSMLSYIPFIYAEFEKNLESHEKETRR